MKNYKVAIVDNSPAAIHVLQEALCKKCYITVVGHATQYEQAKFLILTTMPDLLFLDIELSGYTGVKLLDEIRSNVTWSMKVVFYTTYGKFVKDALRTSVFDFLLKPFSFEELDDVLDGFLKTNENAINSNPLTTDLLIKNPSFLVSTFYGFKVMHASQIGAFCYERERRQWLVVHVDSNEQFLKRNTTAAEILGYSPCFVQINQQQIINVNYLASIKYMHCLMRPPFDNISDLTIKRKYCGMLHEVFQLI